MALADCLKKFPSDPNVKNAIVSADRAVIERAADAYEKDGMPRAQAEVQAVEDMVDVLAEDLERLQGEVKGAFENSGVGKKRKAKAEKKAAAAVEPVKEEPVVEAKPMRLFHGSPNDSIDAFKGVTFFTPNRAVAEEFAKGQLAGSAKTEATAPRVYEADVVLGNTLDMRTPEGKGAYAEAREAWNKAHPDDRLPPVTSEGFLISKSGLPSFGYARTLLQAMPAYDSVVVDEGSQGESYAVRDGAAQAKIADLPKPEDLGELGTREYRIGEPASVGTMPFTIDAIEKWFAPVLAKMSNAPAMEVVAEPQDIPGVSPGGAKGAMQGGKIYVVAVNVESKFDAYVTFYHELVGHYGLRGVLGEQYAPVLSRIAANSPKVRAGAAAWRAANAAEIEKRTKAGATAEAIRLLSIEEAIAEMAHVGAFERVLRQVASAIAKVLRAMGMDSLADRIDRANDAEVMELLAASRNWLRNGEGSVSAAAETKLFNHKAAKSQEGAEPLEVPRRGAAAKGLAEIGKTIQVDNLGRMRRGVLGLQFLRDLKDQYAAKLPAVQAFVDRVFAMSASANELLKKASQTAKRWDALSDEQSRVLSNLQATATVMGIHPDIPLDDKMHLTASGLEISNKHLMQQDGTFSDDVKAGHAGLAAEWAKLQSPARGVYTSARDEMARNWTERERLLNKTIHKYFDPEIAKAEALGNTALVRSLTKERKEYLAEFGRLLSRVKGPYFPLSRFGDFFVVHKSPEYLEAEAKLKEANDKLRELYTKHNIPEEDASLINSVNAVLEEHNLQPIQKLPDDAKKEVRAARKEAAAARKVVHSMQGQEAHYVNAAFESEAQARAYAAERGVSVRLKEEYLREVSSTSYSMINKIGDAIEGSINDKRMAMQARETMMRVWLQSLPDTSALRHQLKRKNIAGFSKDMLRAFSQYSQRDAHYLSRLSHMDDIMDSLQQLRRDTRGQGLEGEEVYNELARRYAASLDFVNTPIQDAISALAFVFQLGVSPAFLLTNLSQPFMISMPVMAAKHGWRSSSKSMAMAWKEVWQSAGTSLREQRTISFEIATGNFSAGEQQMLQDALKAGLLEITLEYDLGALADGGETKVSRFTRAMAIVPHQAEVVNRMATALAAYRMEVGKVGQAKATEYAMDVISRTHYDYSAANAPYFLKPGVVPMSKLIFQYRKYQLGTLTLLARQIGAAFKGQTPEARAEARRALVGIAAMHGTFAGAMGLPFVGSLTFLANVVAAAFGDDDQPFDAEVEMRNWFADILGKDAGAAAAKGIPMLLGADLSNKIGMGSIAAPIRVLRDTKEGRDLYLEALAAMAGPAIGGLGPRFADGFKQMEDGNLLKAAELFTPKFASDVIKAARLTTEGQVTKSGNVSTKPEEISAWDAALSGLGIQPASLTERSAATAAVFDAKEALKKRRGELERNYVKARVDGDSEAMSEIRAQIEEFNAKRRARNEPIIKTADLMNAFRQRKAYDQNRTEEGVSLRRSERALGQYGRFADVQ